MKRCGLCGYEADNDDIFAKHLRRKHAWQERAVDDRPGIWRSCATLVVIVLGIYGVGALVSLVVVAPSPESWPLFLSLGAALLVAALAVWFRWLRRS